MSRQITFVQVDIADFLDELLNFDTAQERGEWIMRVGRGLAKRDLASDPFVAKLLGGAEAYREAEAERKRKKREEEAKAREGQQGLFSEENDNTAANGSGQVRTAADKSGRQQRPFITNQPTNQPTNNLSLSIPQRIGACMAEFPAQREGEDLIWRKETQNALGKLIAADPAYPFEYACRRHGKTPKHRFKNPARFIQELPPVESLYPDAVAEFKKIARKAAETPGPIPTKEQEPMLHLLRQFVEPQQPPGVVQQFLDSLFGDPA